MKKKLLKDIVIPAGTIFDDAASKTVRSSGHVETIIGLTNNTFGSLVYFVDDYKEELKEWFSDIESGPTPLAQD